MAHRLIYRNPGSACCEHPQRRAQQQIGSEQHHKENTDMECISWSWSDRQEVSRRGNQKYEHGQSTSQTAT